MSKTSNDWQPVGNGTPLAVWIETKRQGEARVNVCCCRMMHIGDEPEWIERGSGRTTVTHGTFLPPTHWRWLRED
jgi:hypothetical protein